MTTTASSPSADKVHQIQATTSPEGEVKFALPIKPELVESVEAIDLDLMLTTTSGEKYILQQGALLATTNTESKLVFSNGDAMSAADQMKRMGVMKPVEGGSFRLASALTPEAADKVTGNEFGLGKDAQDTVAKIEKLLQSLESATQPSQNSEASNSSAAPGKNSAFKSNADPLASPAPGTPPKTDTEVPTFTGGDYLLKGAQEKVVANVELTAGKGLSLSSVETKSLMSSEVVELTATGSKVTLEPGGLIHNTLVLPGSSSATYISVTKTSLVSTEDFKIIIEGTSITDQIGKYFTVKGFDQIAIDIAWEAKSANQTIQSKTFQTVVTYYDGNFKAIGSKTIEFFYGKSGDSEYREFDKDGNSILFLNANSLNYSLKGTDASDELNTGKGNDRIDGGAGVDTMRGLAGDDTYVVDNVGDLVTENTDEGTDTVEASVTYTLSANVDNLTLTGNAAINGTGNADNNVITGNAAINRLDGGTGNDTMIGGAGDDTYVVDNIGDVVTESNAAGAGTDTIEASVNYTLSANVEKLILKEGSGNINGTGNGLANTLTGNSANNRLDGGASNDTMIGGAGDDTYVVDSTDDVITENAGGGTDTVEASVTYTLSAHVDNLTLTGNAAINGTGNADNNVITGNAAINRLDGGTGNDTMIGGAGDDTYVVDSTGDLITENAGGGTDTVEASVTYTLFAHVDNLTLTGNAAINGTGNADNNVITGNAAINRLDGGTGNDTMIGGAGDDTYVVDNIGDVVTESNAAGAGTDTIEASVNYTLSANVEKLILKEGSGNINGTGNGLANTLTGNSANNRLDGGASNDTMIGGAGDDTYVVDSTDDVITENAGEGSDTVETSANYTLAADLESLTLTGSDNINGTGNGLDNTILGNSGNNVLVGGAGNDTLNGGGGTDTASYTNTTPIIATLGLNGVNGSATGDGTDVLISIENLQGGGGNDTLTGNEQANKLEGGGGNDTLNGGSGSDTLDGGVGADSMTGGLGDDTYVVDSTGDAVTEAAGEGTDTVQSTITYILGENLENLTLTGSNVINGTGNSANNILNGNSSANRLDGGLGADTMAGGAGDDTYVVDNSGDVVTEAASAGADTIEASVSYTLSANVEKLILKEGSGNINATGNVDTNTLIGNSGNNILDGGNGDDTLIGGGGSDTLIGGGGSDTLVVSASDLKSSIFKGESGTDTLKIKASSSAPIDLTDINNANFVSIEKIDLTETTGNTVLKLNLESIRSLVDISSGIPTLSVKLGSGDTISFAPESNQQVFDNASSKTMTVFGSSGSSLEQLAIISYA